jgi:hypothetical protein
MSRPELDRPGGGHGAQPLSLVHQSSVTSSEHVDRLVEPTIAWQLDHDAAVYSPHHDEGGIEHGAPAPQPLDDRLVVVDGLVGGHEGPIGRAFSRSNPGGVPGFG